MAHPHDSLAGKCEPHRSLPLLVLCSQSADCSGHAVKVSVCVWYELGAQHTCAVDACVEYDPWKHGPG